MLSRLGITYGVLRRLGFTEERVEGCLRGINGVELEEAFDWVTIHSKTLLPFCAHRPIASSSLQRRGNRSRRAWNTKIIKDLVVHAYRSLHTAAYPPDTSHPSSTATLSLPSSCEVSPFACTFAIGRQCACLHSFVWTSSIAAT